MTFNTQPSDASSKSNKVGRQKSASYPGFTFQQAEDLARTVFEIGPRNCDKERVAQAAGYKTTKSGSFIRLKSTSKQFELIRIEKSGDISVTEEWVEIIHNSEDLKSLKQARRRAVARPKLYKQLIEEYTKRQLPPLEKLSRELYINPKYGILKDAAETAARLFLESANYTGLLDSKGYLVDFENIADAEDTESYQQENSEQLPSDPLQNSIVETSDESTKEISVEVDHPQAAPNLDGLEKYEITLINRKKAYLYVPVPLPNGEKHRLKQYIDLILEEPESSVSSIVEH